MSIAYWPPYPVPREATLSAFEAAYESLGYRRCDDGSLEKNTEKIVIYAIEDFSNALIPTHAARQLKSGKWTSKLGTYEDVEHLSPDDLNGPVYGKVHLFMSRPLTV